MKAFITAMVLAWGAAVRCRGAEPVGLIIQTNYNWNIGDGFRNLYGSATKDQALAKLARLRQSVRPVSVRVFLGDKLRTVRIISFFQIGTAGPVQLVREVLGSAILEPENRGGPGLGPAMWSELTTINVRVLLEYANGRAGILETDGTHLFFEDSDGTYWWHRWDSSFPRRLIEEGAGAADRKAVHSITNQMPAAPGPGAGLRIPSSGSNSQVRSSD